MWPAVARQPAVRRRRRYYRKKRSDHIAIDRAVFHFLTDPKHHQRYRANLLKALRMGGHLIMATFALEAPPKCSGLPVERYGADKLESVLGSDFELKRQHKELHVTPGGTEQIYLYCHFQRTA